MPTDEKLKTIVWNFIIIDTVNIDSYIKNI